MTKSMPKVLSSEELAKVKDKLISAIVADDIPATYQSYCDLLSNGKVMKIDGKQDMIYNIGSLALRQAIEVLGYKLAKISQGRRDMEHVVDWLLALERETRNIKEESE